MQQAFKSRFNYKFYFGLILFIPFLGIAAIGIGKLVENIAAGNPFGEVGFTMIMPGIFLALIGYIVHFMYRHSPIVLIEGKQVRIGKDCIAVSELDAIHLQTYHDTYFFFIYYQEVATTIILKSGQKYILFAGHYLNGSLMLLNLAGLSDSLKGKVASFSPILHHKKEQPQQFTSASYVEYRQPPYTCFNYYLLGGFALIGFGVAVYLPVSGTTPWPVSLIALVVSTLFTFILVVQSHYFLLADDHLLVRNYLFPWKKRTFAVADIYSAFSEQIGNQETALRVTTNDFKVHRYQSGLLDDALFEHLTISIQNKQKALRTQSVFQLQQV